MRNNLDLSIADLGDLHNIAEVTDAAVDLDLVLEELLEGGDVEDLVACGLRSVDDELGFLSCHHRTFFPQVPTSHLIRLCGKGRRSNGAYLLGDLGLLALG